MWFGMEGITGRCLLSIMLRRLHNENRCLFFFAIPNDEGKPLFSMGGSSDLTSRGRAKNG